MTNTVQKGRSEPVGGTFLLWTLVCLLLIPAFLGLLWGLLRVWFWDAWAAVVKSAKYNWEDLCYVLPDILRILPFLGLIWLVSMGMLVVTGIIVRVVFFFVEGI